MRSEELFAEAVGLLPGGVSSPVRAFRAVGGSPLFIERGEGAYLVDVDGNRYVDYVLSWGPLILGHAHPRVVAALEEAVRRGTSYGAPSPLELDLARLIRDAMPSVELVRFVNSGTEATMSALRLARAFTGRAEDRQVHGLLPRARRPPARAGRLRRRDARSARLSRRHAGAVADTLTAPYNDLEAVERLFGEHADIAAVIVEPVAGNMGLVPPVDGFLEGLRELTAAHGALLVFDEVMTGFRVHPGGAQALYGVTPDLTTLGKVIGGGLPVGRLRREARDHGARRAGRARLPGRHALREPARDDGGDRDAAGALPSPGSGTGSSAPGNGSSRASRRSVLRCRSARVGTMFGLFFTEAPVRSWEDAKQADTARFATFHRAMLERGVYLAPSQFEAAFLSTAHGDDEIDATIAAAEESLQAIS